MIYSLSATFKELLTLSGESSYVIGLDDIVVTYVLY